MSNFQDLDQEQQIKLLRNGFIILGGLLGMVCILLTFTVYHLVSLENEVNSYNRDAYVEVYSRPFHTNRYLGNGSSMNITVTSKVPVNIVGVYFTGVDEAGIRFTYNDNTDNIHISLPGMDEVGTYEIEFSSITYVLWDITNQDWSEDEITLDLYGLVTTVDVVAFPN